MTRFDPFKCILCFALLMTAVGCGTNIQNEDPIITSLVASDPTISPGSSTRITVTATDPDGDILSYDWEATGGSLDTDIGSSVNWTAPQSLGTFVLTVHVEDSHGGSSKGTINITVQLVS